MTFVDPADYDKVCEADRVALRGLTSLQPGSLVTVELSHDDGSTESFSTAHTLNQEQIAWFRAGSALNCIRAEQGLA